MSSPSESDAAPLPLVAEPPLVTTCDAMHGAKRACLDSARTDAASHLHAPRAAGSFWLSWGSYFLMMVSC
jgi:hypothetical protein